MKRISIVLLISMFLGFFTYELFQQQKYEVLEVVSPTEIVVDSNGNGVGDEDETVVLSTVESFSSKPNKQQSELAKRLKLTEEDALGLGFLAQNFAKTTLLEKEVKLTKSPRALPPHPRGRVGVGGIKETSSKIYIDDKNYETLLINSGLAVEKNAKGEKITPQLQKNLEKVQKLHLVIFNNKSHKYHKLNCKYGLMAHNSQILPVSQMPKDAKPCKFCMSNHHKNQYHKYHHKKWVDYDIIPNIPQAPVFFQTSTIKIFLTDLTRVLKPSSECRTQVCQALLHQVDSAQNSIDFAIYGYTKIPALQKSFENAQKRGVKIRFVYDIDTKNENLYTDTLYLTKILQQNNADFGDNHIMHNKFFIFDNKTVLTGSANISNTDMSGFNSNAVVLINSPQVANVYSQEFEQMYSGKFHKKKSKIEKNEPVSDDVSVYFSPSDNAITSQIIPLIDNSQKYIYMPIFLITHKKLADSLIRASQRGVSVKVILDATNAHGGASKHKLLRANGIPVKTENFAGKLHSKSIIIDDMYTIIGSMNFSRSGEGVNDENLVIIKNRGIALFYKTFFQYLWKRIPDKWLKYNARAESPDSVGSCSDGIDNDFDKKIDMADDSCKITFKSKGKEKGK